MRVWWRRYAALVRSAWLVDLQYPAAIAIWMVWNVTEPAIALGIWWSIAGSGTVQGYARDDFVRYFFAVTLINQLTLAWDAWYIDRWVREGELNFRLTRPISPVHEAVSDNIAYKLRTGGAALVLWIAVACFWPAARLAWDPGRWALAALAAVLAAGIRFFNGYATGLLAFWTTRVSALMELQFGISLFLSGRIAPLSFLPPAVVSVAGVLWFPYMLAFPVEILTGAVHTTADYWHGFAGQVAWLVAWWLLYVLVWHRGLKRYGAVGG
ncbi:MAG TPA: ABC-2 family transporter protein [Gemmatimonadales bacterium]|nr:ABC-2 family transporter protein [Gemmatimonadales bacterium]